MSVPVDLEQLAEALADFTFAYLITVGDDFRAHAVAVDPVLTDGVFEVTQIGRNTRRNATAHAGVTLVWPPAEPGGYSLIVDGRGSLASDEAPLVVVPGRAVLHRKATACPSDSWPTVGLMQPNWLTSVHIPHSRG